MVANLSLSFCDFICRKIASGKVVRSIFQRNRADSITALIRTHSLPVSSGGKTTTESLGDICRINIHSNNK